MIVKQQKGSLQSSFGAQKSQGQREIVQKKQKFCSEFTDEYRKYIQKNLTIKETIQIHQILRSNNVIVDENNFRSSLEIQITETDFESFSMWLHYGIYKIKISVLMTEMTNSYFTNPISNGTYGNIYSMALSRQFYAIKRVLFKKQFILDEELEKVYKEYFLCFIASILKVGPKMQNIFGYDIIVTNNSALFAMELCQNHTKQKHEIRKKQSIENLRVLHALNFVHQDIKPENLAYSPSFKKSVYIDFGLSRLIQEEVGEKTSTHFVGTLSCCSEEMKKAYFLSKPRLIDLYHNDTVSLKISLDKIKPLSDLSKHEDDNEASSQSEAIYYVFEKNSNIIQQTLYVFQMKFHIFSTNKEEVLKISMKIKGTPKSFFAILNNKTTKKFFDKNEQVKEQIMKIRKKITEQKSKGSSIGDKIVSQALEKSNENQGVSKFTISQQMLNLPNQSFKLIIQNQQFMCNIILYLDDFSKQNKNEQKQRLIFKLLKKIYGIRNENAQVEIYKQITHFIKYLTSNLKTKRNYKTLNVLRMIFIRLENLKQVEPLEDEIINLIKDPVLKCLKIVQFALFWSKALFSLEHQKERIWYKIINQLQTKQNKNQFVKIKKFSLTILQLINRKCPHELDLVSNQLKLLQQFCADYLHKQYRQQISIIKYMSLQILQIRSEKAKNIYTLRFYSAYFSSFQHLRTEESSFLRIFKSLLEYMQKNNWAQKQIKSIKNEQHFFSYVFGEFGGRPDLIRQSVVDKFHTYIRDKNSLILYIDKYTENFEILCQKFINFNEYQLINSPMNISRLIYFLTQFTKAFSTLQFQIILRKIERIIFLYKQKVIFGHNKNISFVFLKIIEVKFMILKNQTNQIQPEIQSIFKQVKSPILNQLNISLIICLSLQQLVAKFPKMRKFHEQLVIYLCDNYMKIENFYLLENGFSTIKHYLRINSQANQPEKNKIFLDYLILSYEREMQIRFRVRNFMEQIYDFIGVYFCFMIPPHKLKNIYDQISFKKEQLQRQCYPYYILSIFDLLNQKFHTQKQAILRQLKRSCLCIKRMFSYEALMTKKIIFTYIYVEGIIQNKRKKLICTRMQMRYFIDKQNSFKKNIFVLKQQVQKIKEQKNKIIAIKEKNIQKKYKMNLKL